MCFCVGAVKLIKCRLLLTNYRTSKKMKTKKKRKIKICSVVRRPSSVVGRFYRVVPFVFTSEFQVRSTKSQPTADSEAVVVVVVASAGEQTNKNRAAAVAIAHIVHTHTDTHTNRHTCSIHITVNVNCVSI